MILHRLTVAVISPAILLMHAMTGIADDVDVSPMTRELVPGVTLTQVSQHPDVVTPTGIDVDANGNIWVVASHTHFRPKDYQGPDHDQIVVIAADGSRRVFYEATDATMDLELGDDGWVYLAERDRVLRVKDSDGDGVGDIEQDIAVLDTTEDYPHNGLSGMAWHPDGDLVFALGENYWTPWTLTGTDQSTETGTGEGGIFRIRPDGSNVRRIARGFWNPFGVCVRKDGTIFAAENDPGARPPCRLIHVVQGGDYGYQREFGNAPFHPFVCWNGELRGTLPMLHSVGEAPCGIAPIANGLIVPTWADHRIDFYPLSPQGASFQTKRVTLVTGGDNFRPVCITKVSDTRFYLTDWVFGSYELHGYGRIWRLDIDPAADWLGEMELAPPNDAANLAERLRQGAPDFTTTQILDHARSDDAFIARAAIDALSNRVGDLRPKDVEKWPLDDQLNLIHAIRKSSPKNRLWLDYFWNKKNEDVRFETLRWITEEKIVGFRDQVEQDLANSDSSYRIFEATLAARNTLAGNPRAGIADADMLMARVTDRKASPITRAYALRLINPTHGKITRKLCDELLSINNTSVTHELTRTLADAGKSFSQPLLRRIASDHTSSVETIANAIAGLNPSDADSRTVLIRFAGSENRVLRDEALRSLRFTQFQQSTLDQLQSLKRKFPESVDLFDAAIDPQSIKLNRPPATDTTAWQDRLGSIAGEPDRAAGARIFFHHRVGTCAKCHRHSGRGMVVGPDLSAASTQGDPNRLLRSLLQPSRDVDPQFYPWSLITEDGVAFTGIMLRKGGTSGKEFYRDSAGKEKSFLKSEITHRKELSTSMMPDGLIDLMTDREIRDLLSFLDNQQ